MRQKLEYKEKVNIPEQFRSLFWDCPDGVTFLEKFIKRILDYGNFQDIRQVYELYPKETECVVFKYKDIRRGIKFWIKLWNKQSANS